jgi:uncharacterized protein
LRLNKAYFSHAENETFHYGWVMPSNVLGTELQGCCSNPMTGFYRDGYCRTGPGDFGQHTVCAVMTDEFLQFSAAMGNDLSTPRPEMDFPGLRAGDRWCLCVQRWQEAFEGGMAPQVVLEACHMSALEFVDREDLISHAVDA